MLGKMDYTQLELGTKIDDGVIEVCPQCGKRGLAVYDPAIHKAYYTHSQSLGFADGQLDVHWESHTVEVKPTTTSSSEQR
jgi:hypothetical protein